jgi:hypothetical protein
LYQLSLDDLIREDADMVKAWQGKEAALRDAAIMMRVSLLLDVGFLLFLLAHEMNVPGFATSHGVGLLIVLMTLTNALAMPRIGRYYRVLRGTTAKRNVWKGVLLVASIVAVTGLLGWTQYANSSVVLAVGYAVAMVILVSPRHGQD